MPFTPALCQFLPQHSGYAVPYGTPHKALHQAGRHFCCVHEKQSREPLGSRALTHQSVPAPIGVHAARRTKARHSDPRPPARSQVELRPPPFQQPDPAAWLDLLPILLSCLRPVIAFPTTIRIYIFLSLKTCG